MNPEDFDQEDEGRVVGIAPGMPGWWVVYADEDGAKWRAPICAWVLREVTIRPLGSRKLRRYSSVSGVDPTGQGWTGEPCDETGNDIYEYVYDPDYRSAERR